MRFLLILTISIFLVSCSHLGRIYSREEINSIKIEEPVKFFEVGEKLVYAVSWTGIPSGKITLEVKEIIFVNGKPVYHIIATAVPNSFFKLFYNVGYTVHSYLDMAELKPVSFHKERSLKGVLTKEDLKFDYSGNIVAWDYSNNLSPEIHKNISIPKNANDLLSALYYFRTKDIVLGSNYNTNIIYNGNVWPVDMSLGKAQQVNIGVGKFEAVSAVLSSKLNDHITGFNDIYLYLSLDRRRIPLLFKMRTAIGHLTGLLISYK